MASNVLNLEFCCHKLDWCLFFFVNLYTRFSLQTPADLSACAMHVHLFLHNMTATWCWDVYLQLSSMLAFPILLVAMFDLPMKAFPKVQACVVCDLC